MERADTPFYTRLGLVGLTVGGVVTALFVSSSFGVASAGPNPPGNNGTVKIDGVAFDSHPDNEPHVGCTFQVDFYGYDEGDLDAEVTFRAHPPTGPVVTLLTDTVFIGEDDNSGGGSEAGHDASETYVLDLTGIAPHPQQGWHVKLTINADGSQGADVKHKVFWVSGCEDPPPPTTTTTTTTAPPTTTTAPPTTTTTTLPPTTTVPPTTTTTLPPTTTAPPTTTVPPTTAPTTSLAPTTTSVAVTTTSTTSVAPTTVPAVTTTSTP